VAALRTLMVTVSPLLGELIMAALLPHFPLDLVGILETREGLAASLNAWSPDLVLLGLQGVETEACAQPVLALLPSVKILVISANGEPALLLENGSLPLVLADLSVPLLIQTLVSRFNIPPPRG